MIRSSCHPSAVIVGGGRERRIESVRGRHRGTTSECVCVCVCVCVFERGVDRLLSRSMCHPSPSVPGSVCVCVCLREKPVDRLVSRSRCHPTPSVLGSVCVCGIVGVGVCVGGGGQ